MKFGLFYSHACPRPWDDTSDQQKLQQALEQVAFADKLGIDYV